jgi:hypothetical protein
MYRGTYRGPKWTFILIGICIMLSILGAISPLIQNILQDLSFVPAHAFQKPWTFVTSIFLHGDIFPIGEGGEVHKDFTHLIWNMFALFLFGIFLEPRIGRRRFLIIFFSAGILGNFAYLITSFNSTIPAVGASGAIFGILGSLAVLYPTLIVWIGFAPMPMIVAALIWTVTSILGLFVPGSIAHEAHLAGLIAGALYGIYLRKKARKIRVKISKY